MADNLTPEQRRRCMSAVKGSRTKPEQAFRKAAWATGLRYRIKSRLPGKPDLVFVKKKTVVFIDGCFWHGCPKHATRPATNVEFWRIKLEHNKKRDAAVNRQLARLQWTVLRFWQHEIKEDIEECLRILHKALKKSDR
jgi:DNA mismatch endonuclease, patch repair protein